MNRLPKDATDSQLRHAVEEWVDLLAESRLNAAVDWLYQTPDQPPLSPKALDDLLQGNWWDSPGATGRHVVTARASAEGPGPRFSVVRLNSDPTAGVVTYDLPMNGRWSSLTALLEFRVVDGSTVFSLQDLHVL